MTLRTVGDEAERCLPEIEEWIAKQSARRLRLAGKLSRAGAVRAECDHPALLSAFGSGVGSGDGDPFLARFRAGQLSADELLARYAARVYRLTGSYEEAARRMGMDRRTVKARVEQLSRREH